MKRIVMGIVLAAFALLAVPRVDAQAQELQQKLAAAKQSAALNQKALRSVLVAREDRIEPEGRSEEHQGRHVQVRTGRQGAEDPGRGA